MYSMAFCTHISYNDAVLSIQKPVFEGIAHEALSECVISLLSASAAIKDKKVQPMLVWDCH